MRGPAQAIAWELWARNRWGLGAVVAGFLVLAALCHTLPAETTAEIMSKVSSPLLFVLFVYLLSVFVYAEAGQGAGRSGFPRRTFTLPVPTALLVAWPMLYGMAAVALFWIAANG